jgi:hypothetical protein
VNFILNRRDLKIAKSSPKPFKKDSANGVAVFPHQTAAKYVILVMRFKTLVTKIEWLTEKLKVFALIAVKMYHSPISDTVNLARGNHDISIRQKEPNGKRQGFVLDAGRNELGDKSRPHTVLNAS